ncbi:MAG: LysR family transcriptional regulator [Pseudomonadota bacterium]
MQIELIETFLDLCATRNFNRTAERMGVTQSAVSGRVKALERALECRLFTRSRSGTELTTEGLRFEPHARGILASWSVGKRAAQERSAAGLTLRIGIQQDLVVQHAGQWIETLRSALPSAAFYVEADFSTQTCLDVTAGLLDLGIVFTPQPHPDLHFETLGDVSYVMVSTEHSQISDVAVESYILPNYSPAIARRHGALYPALSAAVVSSGQNAIVAGLLGALGGTTYLLADTAAEFVESGAGQYVAGAARIEQSVYGALHLRNRHRGPHKRMLAVVRGQLGG